jgi:hypothetical protein
MKKSIIEKQLLANRLRKKINEDKNEIILSDGKNSYSLNENELKSIIDEAVSNVLKRNNLF